MCMSDICRISFYLILPESLIGIFDKLKPNINAMIIAHYMFYKF